MIRWLFILSVFFSIFDHSRRVLTNQGGVTHEENEENDEDDELNGADPKVVDEFGENIEFHQIIGEDVHHRRNTGISAEAKRK